MSTSPPLQAIDMLTWLVELSWREAGPPNHVNGVTLTAPPADVNVTPTAGDRHADVAGGSRAGAGQQRRRTPLGCAPHTFVLGVQPRVG